MAGTLSKAKRSNGNRVSAKYIVEENICSGVTCQSRDSAPEDPLIWRCLKAGHLRTQRLDPLLSEQGDMSLAAESPRHGVLWCFRTSAAALLLSGEQRHQAEQ